MLRRLCLLLVASVLIAADAPKPAPIPIATFAELPFFANPTLSPDGRMIAAEILDKGKAKLFIVGVPDLKTVRIVDLSDMTIAAIRWAGPNHVLLTVNLQVRVGGIAMPEQRLLDVALPSGVAKVLDAKSQGLLAGDVLYVDPAGGSLLVSSQNDIFSTPSVKRIDLASGAVTVVEKAQTDVWDWYADSTGTVRAGIDYEKDRWIFWYRDATGAPLRKVVSRHPAGGDSGVVDSVTFLSAVDQGVIVTNAATGRFAAYDFNFKTGAIGPAIYQNDQVDVASVVTGPRGGVTGIAYEDDRRRVAWIDPAMAAVQRKIDQVFPGAENMLLNASNDGNRILVWSGGAADPGTYYVYDIAAHRLERVVQPYEKLSGLRLAPVAAVRYAARDALPIPAYLTLPPGRAAHGLPLVVMPHGGPFARDDWDYDPFVQFLASRGYAVLQPEFRGSTGYGKDFVERGYGQWGRTMQDDLDDGVDWLVKSGQVDAGRVCIMGASYGGYAALWGAIRNPERYRCAISLAGVTDVAAILRYDRQFWIAPRYRKAWQAKVQGQPDMDLALVSPLQQQARLHVPVLIAHGERDVTVPPRQSHQLVDALRKRGYPVEAHFYPEEKHGFSKPEDLVDYLTRLEAFLARNNPA